MRLSEGKPRQASIHEVGDLHERLRRRHAVKRYHAIFDAAVSADQDRKRPGFAQGNEIELPEPHLLLWSEHDPGGLRQAGQCSRRSRKCVLDRLVADDLRVRSRAAHAGREPRPA